MSGNGKRPWEKDAAERPYNTTPVPPPWELPEVDPRPEVPLPEPEDPIDRHRLPKIPWIDRRASDRGEDPVPERLWIIPDWIPREQVTGLYGPPGVNKTDFLIQLLMAKSRGLVFMGYQLEPAPTYGLFCEDTEEEIDRRIARIAEHYGLWVTEFPDFHYSSLVGYDDLEFVTFDKNEMLDSRSLKRFDMKIEESGAVMACLDTAPHFFGGSEIDRRQVSRFLRKLDSISIGRKCGIVISAHPSARGAKSNGRMDSGSTGWEGGVRARIALTKPEQDDDEDGKPPADTNDRKLTLWKSNYAPPGKTIDLIWEKGVFTTSALDSEKAKTRGPGRNDACNEKFLELLRAVTAQGGYVHDSANVPARYAPQVFASRPDGKEFSKTEYTRAMMRLLGTGKLRYEQKRGSMRLVEGTTADSQNAA
jgi:hypothetical protein